MYDVVRFDALHPSYNSDELLGMQKVAYEKAKALSRFVQPMEYGTTWQNKRIICSLIAKELLVHMIDKAHHPGINLYFVSESHIQALINLFTDAVDYSNLNNMVDFMAHLLIKIYVSEDTGAQRMEIYVSNGAYQNPFKMDAGELGVPRIQSMRLLGDNYQPDFLEALLSKVNGYIEMTKERFDLGFNVLSNDAKDLNDKEGKL